MDRHSRGATQHPLTLAEPAIRQYITTARDYHNCLIERIDCVRSDAMTHVLYKLLTTFMFQKLLNTKNLFTLDLSFMIDNKQKSYQHEQRVWDDVNEQCVMLKLCSVYTVL